MWFSFKIGDPCAQNPCLNGGQCIPNGLGGFTCNCQNPYTGQRCEDRKEKKITKFYSTQSSSLGVDPCASQPCRNGATCRPINGNSYQCICPPGYSGFDCSTRKLFMFDENENKEACR